MTVVKSVKEMVKEKDVKSGKSLDVVILCQGSLSTMPDAPGFCLRCCAGPGGGEGVCGTPLSHRIQAAFQIYISAGNTSMWHVHRAFSPG